MSHIHKVIDTDIHYKIDGVTRTIVNIDETKRSLVQYDHNSERLTFEIPRYVDGHDFSECNAVQVHFENVDMYGKNKSPGLYNVNDVHVKQDDEDTVVLSWLVSGDGTKYVGTLDFSIRFACITNGVTDYAWNTALFKGIVILQGLFNSNNIIQENYDILSELIKRVAALEKKVQNGSGSENTSASSTAILGIAELGEMILGMEV